MSDGEYTPCNEARLRKKKEKCPHEFIAPDPACNCTAYRCFKCGRWKDNLANKQQEKIALLLTILQGCVDTKSYPLPSDLQAFENVIIKSSEIDRLRKRYSHASTNG
jgi:hypothetical protein